MYLSPQAQPLCFCCFSPILNLFFFKTFSLFDFFILFILFTFILSISLPLSPTIYSLHCPTAYILHNQAVLIIRPRLVFLVAIPFQKSSRSFQQSTFLQSENNPESCILSQLCDHLFFFFTLVASYHKNINLFSADRRYAVQPWP